MPKAQTVKGVNSISLYQQRIDIMIQNIHNKNIIIIMIFTFLLLCLITGCTTIGENVKYQSEVSDILKGEDEFFKKNYSKANDIFGTMYDGVGYAKLNSRAIYNYACSRLVTSKNEKDINEALKLLEIWVESKQDDVNVENPRMLKQALEEMFQSNKSNRNSLSTHLVKKDKTIKSLDEIIMNLTHKLKQMSLENEILKHQIVELETIDQEIQKKGNELE